MTFSVQGRVIAYLLCPAVIDLGWDVIKRAVSVTFPRFAEGMAPLGSCSPGSDGFGFVLAGVPLSCIVVPAALPRTEWEVGTLANPAWPGAAGVASAQRAHVVIAPLGEVTDRTDALRKAVACTMAAAALMPVAEAEAVCWYPAQTLVQPRTFIAMAQEMMTGDQLGSLPLDAWMRLEFGRMEGRYAAVARGLVPLLGHDLMVVGDAADPATQGGLLYNVAGYLIRERRSFADGDTMEVGTDRLTARYADGAPMVRLEMMRRDG